ncbi:MAG: hypothetical protein IIW88_03955 [Clostridia bacterium]|nr:hypothetical protein [Clostridia bacterium]
MKKILRNIFLCILAIIVAAIGGVWYTLFGVSEKPVDVDVTESSTASSYTGPNIDVEINPDDYTGAVSTTIPTTNNSGEPTTAGKNEKPQQTPGSTTAPAAAEKDPYRLEAFRIKQYHQAISSGTFLMETTMEDEELGSTPVIMAVKNGNTYVETSMSSEGINLDAKVIYIGSTNTTYLIIDNWKKYTKLPAELMGDTEGLDMAGTLQESYSEEEIKNVKVSEVELGGKRMILESYNSGGTTVNYYFDGDKLVRRDDVYSDGTVASTVFKKFTTNVPDSYFEVPDGYGYLNLSWLESLGAFE